MSVPDTGATCYRTTSLHKAGEKRHAAGTQPAFDSLHFPYPFSQITAADVLEFRIA